MSQKLKKEHYVKGYDDLPRFISYFYQVSLIRDANPASILEVGVGNKTVSNYLLENGFKVSTCDHDPDLKPDYVADIRKLPFEDNSFDLVASFEVLEHLPWSDFNTALSELGRVTRKYSIISLPYASSSFEFLIKFPFIRRIFKKPFLNPFLRVPIFGFKMKMNKAHHWEIGRKNYSIKKVRKEIEKIFIIDKEVRPPLNSYHHFFVLRKKK